MLDIWMRLADILVNSPLSLSVGLSEPRAMLTVLLIGFGRGRRLKSDNSDLANGLCALCDLLYNL